MVPKGGPKVLGYRRIEASSTHANLFRHTLGGLRELAFTLIRRKVEVVLN